MSVSDPDGVEHVLAATRKDLEQNEVFGTRERESKSEELVVAGSPKAESSKGSDAVIKSS